MKKNFDESKLTNAALTDEGWEAYRGQLRDEGLAALRAKRLTRRWMSAAQIAAMLVVCGAVLWSLDGTKGIRNKQVARNRDRISNLSGPPVNSNTLRAGDRPRSGGQKPPLPYVTEEEMMAMFPKGSCVVAEVNGQKELVFLDQRGAKEGFRVTE